MIQNFTFLQIAKKTWDDGNFCDYVPIISSLDAIITTIEAIIDNVIIFFDYIAYYLSSENKIKFNSSINADIKEFDSIFTTIKPTLFRKKREAYKILLDFHGYGGVVESKGEETPKPTLPGYENFETSFNKRVTDFVLLPHQKTILSTIINHPLLIDFLKKANQQALENPNYCLHYELFALANHISTCRDIENREKISREIKEYVAQTVLSLLEIFIADKIDKALNEYATASSYEAKLAIFSILHIMAIENIYHLIPFLSPEEKICTTIFDLLSKKTSETSQSTDSIDFDLTTPQHSVESLPSDQNLKALIEKIKNSLQSIIALDTKIKSQIIYLHDNPPPPLSDSTFTIQAIVKNALKFLGVFFIYDVIANYISYKGNQTHKQVSSTS